MKKISMASAIIAACIAYSASADKLTYKSSVAEFRAAYESAIASTNVEDIKKALLAAGFWECSYTKDPEVVAFRAEADRSLAAKGVRALWEYPVTWPMVSAKAREGNGAGTNLVVRFSIAERLGCDAMPSSIAKAGGTIGDLTASLEEVLRFVNQPMYITTYGINEHKRAIQSLAVKGVKKALRRQGKSFVTKDGINPCEKYLTALNVALNAPRLEGLDAWLKDLGFAKGFDTSSLPSEREVESLKEKILDGDVDLTEAMKTQMYICLGVDGYNAFVKEYNGDKE